MASLNSQRLSALPLRLCVSAVLKYLIKGKGLHQRIQPILLLPVVLPGFAAAEALQWEKGAGYRSAVVSPGKGSTGLLLQQNASLGITFTNSLPVAKAELNHNLLNGAGLAAGDFDGDGLPDLFFCNLTGPSALYRNLGGWKFEDVTTRAGVGCTNQSSTGAMFADFNGDGLPDLFVTSCGGPNSLFLNLSGGLFTNVTSAAGLTSRAGSTSIAAADVDGDGWLDLYVANYGETTIRSGARISTKRVNGKDVVTGRLANRVKIVDGALVELGEPDMLALNHRDGTFTVQSWTEGRFRTMSGASLPAAPWDMGLSAVMRDFNGDGVPDIYVCNDFQTPDRFWLNDGKGLFQSAGPEVIPVFSHFAMTVDVADLDRDGFYDFFVADMKRRTHRRRLQQSLADQPVILSSEWDTRPQIRQNMLYHARGDGSFEEMAAMAGLEATDWTWCAAFLDVDLDGYEDLLVATGHAFDTEDADVNSRAKAMRDSGNPEASKLRNFPTMAVPNGVFRNRHDLTFSDESKSWGFDNLQTCHGIAFADLDNDGDMDVIVSSLNGPPLIYRNDSSAPRIAVRLKGKAPNTAGIGANIRLIGKPVTQMQEMVAGGRYLSGDAPQRTFAAPDTEGSYRLEVRWRSGEVSTIGEVKANRLYEIEESGSVRAPATSPATEPSWFAPVSLPQSVRHEEAPQDDFAAQPLLPHKLSELWASAAWIDLDEDGWEDLVLGAGRGDQLWLLRNHHGVFDKTAVPTALAEGSAGFTALSFQGPALLAGIQHPGAGSTLGSAAWIRLRPQGSLQASPFAGSPVLRNPGPFAVADVDNDGLPDVFMGSRSEPGKYPRAEASVLLMQTAAGWKTNAAAGSVFSNTGMVSGAVFTDLNGDGRPDLVIAEEWGSIRVYLNENGTLREATKQLGLGRYAGWWTGVAAGDFDGDGRMDIVAGNWGRNTPYQSLRGKGLRLYYGDLDGDGRPDLIEAHFDEETGGWVPRRSLEEIAKGVPSLRQRFASNHAFSLAKMEDVLGGKPGVFLEADWLESTVFLNRGDHFEAIPLPAAAQIAPVFGIAVADFNGDGKEDLFLAQNFSAVPQGEKPLNSGGGLLLKGIGDGTFAKASLGAILSGEQRGAAVADFDHDGRTDLVVGVHSGEWRLLRNVVAKPGVRITLHGASGNPGAIGAKFHLLMADGKATPARELHGGSGSGSQDSLAQVVHPPTAATRMIAQWPEGLWTTNEIAPGALEVSAQQPK